jgi:hypothetical protein
VDQDVEGLVGGGPAVEDDLDLLIRLHVARFDEGRSDRLGKRADTPLDQAFDRGEADLRTLVMERPRNAPGDRMVVRNAKDQRVAAVEQAHPCPPASNARSIAAPHG